MTRWDCVGIVFVLCLGLALAPAVRGQEGEQAPPAEQTAPQGTTNVLSVIPTDAWAVVVVRNLNELDRKLMALSQHLNVQPISALQMAKMAMGLSAGINDDGGVAGVLLPVPNVVGNYLGGLVILVPVTDYNALATSLQAQEPVEGVSKAMLMQQESYVAKVGDFAVLAQSPEPIKLLIKGQETAGLQNRWSPTQLDHFKTDDVAVWINAESILSDPQIQPMLMILAGASGGSTTMEQIQALRDLMVSLKIEKGGVQAGLYVGLKEGTEPAKAMVSGGATTEPLLVGLPGEEYIFALGMHSSAEAAKYNADMILAGLSNPALKAKVDAEKLEQLKQILQNTLLSVRHVAFDASALPAGPDGIVGLAKVVEVSGDAKVLARKFSEVVNLLASGLIADPEVQKAMTMVRYVEDAETVADVPVDHLIVDMSQIEEIKPEDLATVKKIIGQEGLLFRIAIVDDKHIAVTLGGSSKRMEAVIATTKANKAPLDDAPGVKAAAGELPDKRAIEAYLSVSRLMSTTAEISKLTDEQPPPAMPKVATPLALVAGPVGAAGYQVDLLVPMELIVALKDMGLMGGPAPAPPAASPQPTPNGP